MRETSMNSQAEDKKQQLLASMQEFARSRLQQNDFSIVQPFLAHYYAQVGADGVLGTNVEDLYGAALAHWQLARGFVSGAPRVHVYNPELEEHGWKSAHTVIEIVNDDMPFLVDSVTMEINRLGLTLHSAIHPVFRVWRDGQGRIEKVQPASDNLPDGSTHATLESWMHFEVDRCSEPEKLEALRTGIAKALSDVRAAVTDWPAMLDAARRSIKELADDHQGDAARQAEVTEARAFLEWLTAGHFIFLGYRDFDLITKDGDNFLQGKADTGLGILRLEERQRTRLFVRRDVLDRYVSCIIFVPREKYTTELRVQIQKLLLKSFNGSSVEFTPLPSESVLARLYITVHARPEGLPNVNKWWPKAATWV
ncbi:hypothetical protein [Noviherbaspirillum cavernae]|uniref:hypothetical protein n=1 Tax=Noviherbaspirillum cavernae TaxID=2320862 RepID=UPI003BF46D7A